MMNYRNPWRNSFPIRLIAAIDMAFASLLISIYFQKFLLPLHYYGNDPNLNDSYRISSRTNCPNTCLIVSVKLFLLGPIIFNAFQIVMAYNLFTAAGKRCEPVIALAKGNTWFQFASVMLVLLLIKLFFVLWFPPQGSITRRDIFGVSLIVLEIVFKVFSLFIVKEFTDDLKYVLNMFPTPQYYCIYTSPLVPPTVTTSNMNTSACCDNVQQPQCANLLQVCTRGASQNRNSAFITVV